MEKVLGEFETIRVKFEGREEHIEISGNGEVRVDSVNIGQSINIFQSNNETTGSYNGQQNAQSVSGEAFYRQQVYIETLIKVHSTGHFVNKELEEAVIKLKELAYS